VGVRGGGAYRTGYSSSQPHLDFCPGRAAKTLWKGV